MEALLAVAPAWFRITNRRLEQTSILLDVCLIPVTGTSTEYCIGETLTFGLRHGTTMVTIQRSDHACQQSPLTINSNLGNNFEKQFKAVRLSYRSRGTGHGLTAHNDTSPSVCLL